VTISVSPDGFATLNGISDVRNVLSEPHKSAFIEGLAYGRPTLEMINDSFETLYAAVKQDKSLSGPDLVAVATACAQVGYLFVAHGFMGKSQRASEVGAAMEKIVAGTDPASAGGPEIDGRFTAPPPPSEETPRRPDHAVCVRQVCPKLRRRRSLARSRVEHLQSHGFALLRARDS